jgi:hypothetical protein
MNWQEDEEKSMTRSFIIWTFHQILLGRLNWGGWDCGEYSMHEGDEKCVQISGWKTWKEETI